MKKSKYLVIVIVIAILLNIIPSSKVLADKDKKTILIINSHTEDYAWTSGVLKGIFKTINPSEISAEIYMENFDYKYYRKHDIEDDIYKLIKERYYDKNIDLVITTDLKATEFAIEHRNRLFKNIPIVFSWISKSKAEEIIKDLDNVAGVVERPNIERTLKTAFKVNPNAKKIYVIHDNTGKGKDSFEEIKKAAFIIDKTVKVETLANVGKIKSEIAIPEIEKDSIIIGTIFLEDDMGMTISIPEIAEKMSREIDKPIFYLQESAIGHGAIGGSMLSPEMHGMSTGKVSLGVLRGEKASEIGLVMENNSKDIYDYNVLKRFKISEKLLPKYSDIINKPYNIHKEQKKIFLYSAIIIGTLLWFIIYLSFNIRKRKQVESEMSLVNQDLVAMQEDLELIAYHDEITGLPNRANFYKKMRKKLENMTGSEILGSILYLDIDDFKDINDNFGHAFGDLVLVEVGNRLRSIDSTITEKNNIFRISGDEYILDIENEGEEKAKQIANEIQKSLSKPFSIKNKEFKISVSIGIVFYPRDGHIVEDIFKKSELSMYKAKELGKSGYVIYEKKMEQEIVERMFLEKNLRDALDKDEFLLNYQPQIEPYSGKIVGFESLIRWNSLEYGFVPPMKFIPVAEQTGGIKKIGEWVLREACIFALNIKMKFNKTIEVSVNISSIQLGQDDFIDIVKNTIKNIGVTPDMIGIEVTETALMESFDVNSKKLETLRDMGFNIYLDDFGTGYSSLNYLLRLPINTIKIDKSFIDEMMLSEKGRKITERIINLAHDMELNVVAEGVEVEEQLVILKKFHCDIIQGYIFGKPLSEEDAHKFISGNIS